MYAGERGRVLVPCNPACGFTPGPRGEHHAAWAGIRQHGLTPARGKHPRAFLTLATPSDSSPRVRGEPGPGGRVDQAGALTSRVRGKYSGGNTPCEGRDSLPLMRGAPPCAGAAHPACGLTPAYAEHSCASYPRADLRLTPGRGEHQISWRAIDEVIDSPPACSRSTPGRGRSRAGDRTHSPHVWGAVSGAIHGELGQGIMHPCAWGAPHPARGHRDDHGLTPRARGGRHR